MTKRRQSPKNELFTSRNHPKTKIRNAKMCLCTRKKYQTTLKVKNGGKIKWLEYPYDRLA